MCLQCTTAAELVRKDALPGFSLMRATLDSFRWRAGQFGLVESNDPMFVFDGPLLPNPTEGFSDEQINAMSESQDAQWDAFARAAQRLGEKLVLPAAEGHRLVCACIASGYDPEQDGELAFWLLHHLSTLPESSAAGRAAAS